MNRWISIDPGNTTGICLWQNTTPLRCWTIGNGRINHDQACDMLTWEILRVIQSEWPRIRRVVIETPVNNGHGNAPLKQAEKVGIIKGLSIEHGVRIGSLLPTEWAARVGITGRGMERKQQALALAGEFLDGVKNHNAADAVCIGLAWTMIEEE